MEQLYKEIYHLYKNKKCRKKQLKYKRSEKFFKIISKATDLKKEQYQEEIEKYICYLWSIYHKKKCDFDYIWEVDIDSSILEKVTFNELLQFISPQTEIV